LKYRVLQEIETETVILKPGQVIKLSEDDAIPLINEGLIFPIERIIYRIFSRLLQKYLWIVKDGTDMKALNASQKATDAIYTATEIRRLKGMNRETLRSIHKIKEIFPASTIEEVLRHVN